MAPEAVAVPTEEAVPVLELLAVDASVLILDFLDEM